MSNDLRDFNDDEMGLAGGDVQDESALTPSGDAIFPGGRETRPLDVVLRRPCPAEVGGKNMVWLGFRMAPSEWPGYLRIGFATDLDFNIATLDIHHSQFEALKAGIGRALKGQSAGIQLTTPAELMSRQFRRQSGALLFEVREGVSDIGVVDLKGNPLMKARLPTPDLMIALRKMPDSLSEISPAPDRRTLRALRGQEAYLLEDMPASMREAAQQDLQLTLPEHWSRPIDRPELLELVAIQRRNDLKYNDLNMRCTSVHLRDGNGLHSLHSFGFDFTQAPLLSVEYTPAESKRKRTDCRPFFKADLAIMRKTIDADFWSLKAGGDVQADIPVESRAGILEHLAEGVEKVQEHWSGKRSIFDRAQFNFWNDELSHEMFFQDQDRLREIQRLKSMKLPVPEELLEPLFPAKGTIKQLQEMAKKPSLYSEFMQERVRAARMMGHDSVPADQWIPVSSQSEITPRLPRVDPEDAPAIGGLFAPR